MKEKIGFIGLGIMGRSMAEHLLHAFHQLYVHTRSPEKAKDILQQGAVWSETPSDIASRCDIIFTIVGFPADVQELYLGRGGLIENMRRGAVFVDMTTSSPELAVKISIAAEKKGGNGLDAPVSGGDKGAREASLSIMAGGDRASFDRALPYLNALGKNIVYHGPAGSGQHCKMCNQIAIAANMLGVCESLAYAEKSGLNPETVLKSITAGAAGSWLLSNLSPRILAGDVEPGFYIKHFIKDLKIALKSAERMNADLPGLRLALSLYKRLAEMGDEDLGTQALYRLYK